MDTAVAHRCFLPHIKKQWQWCRRSRPGKRRSREANGDSFNGIPPQKKLGCRSRCKLVQRRTLLRTAKTFVFYSFAIQSRTSFDSLQYATKRSLQKKSVFGGGVGGWGLSSQESCPSPHSQAPPPDGRRYLFLFLILSSYFGTAVHVSRQATTKIYLFIYFDLNIRAFNRGIWNLSFYGRLELQNNLALSCTIHCTSKYILSAPVCDGYRYDFELL